MRLSSKLLYLGMALVVAGFALIAITWGRVAGLTSVPLQLPYLVSGGFASVGLILVGLTIVNIDSRVRDAARRDRQLGQVTELLDQIRLLVGGDEE